MTGKNEYRLSDDGLTAHIALTQGKEAIVDVCDLELVLRFRWHALRIRKAFYAVTRLPSWSSRWTSHIDAGERTIHLRWGREDEV